MSFPMRPMGSMPMRPMGSMPIRPIGSSNPLNPDLRVHFDKAHGGQPDHVDMIKVLKNLGCAHKIKVDGNGKIIFDDIV